VKVEEAIVLHRADAMRAWSASSGAKKPSMEVPESLIARRQACTEATESGAAAASVRKALSKELDSAKAALADAERSVKEAALTIVLEEAERVATYLDAARREVWRLATQLRGLGEVWLPTGKDQAPRPVRLSPPVLAVLNAQEPQYPPAMRPEIKQSAAWRAFHTALLTDPDKTWEEEAT
jgi:hypothetical protein